jgi:hypothetical protein
LELAAVTGLDGAELCEMQTLREQQTSYVDIEIFRSSVERGALGSEDANLLELRSSSFDLDLLRRDAAITGLEGAELCEMRTSSWARCSLRELGTSSVDLELLCSSLERGALGSEDANLLELRSSSSDLELLRRDLGLAGGISFKIDRMFLSCSSKRLDVLGREKSIPSFKVSIRTGSELTLNDLLFVCCP